MSKSSYKLNKKLDRIYHVESNLVVKSQAEKLVVGRLENGEFIPLDERAVELCDEFGLKYDESLVEDDSENAEEPSERPSEVPKDVPKDVPDEKKSESSVSEEPAEAPAERPAEALAEALAEVHSKQPAERPAFSLTLKRFCDEMNLFVSEYDTELTKLRTQVSDLISQLESSRGEVDSVKKKLKKLLASYQDEL